jgi:lipopolysaccharide/colanic/teichoic acid biosynthesis glycosyltransferase
VTEPTSRWLRCRFTVDRVVAGVALVVASPVIGILAAAVRRHDGGPGLIAVPRVGRGGATFDMWKIRSMRAESDDGRAGGMGLTRGDDDRITPIGRRLRALHLDELPQLVNVVRGEMLLLGPRPEAPQFVDLDDPEWQAVLRSPPGIAGPTQLVVGDWEREVITSSADESDYVRVAVPVKLAIDRWYVESASPMLDAVVVATLGRRLTGRSEAGRLRNRVRAAVPQAESPISWSEAQG